MPDTGAPWNIPYVAGTDLVADWPTDNQTMAEAIADALDVGLGTNVVQATKLDTFTTTSTSFTDVTDLSVTITPSSATSKVLIIAQVAAGSSTSNGHSAFLALTGGNSAGYIGAAASTRVQCVVSFRGDGTALFGNNVPGSPIVFLDSPATTLATTYKVQGRVSGGGTLYVNRTATDTANDTYGRQASSLTVIEVAA